MHADFYSRQVDRLEFLHVIRLYDARSKEILKHKKNKAAYFYSVIGVVQMVNKTGGPFMKADEDAFETFAIYCGLALHHAKLYDKIRRSEQKYRVALEVLAYHSVCNKDEVNKLKKVKLRDRIVELET